ncbi:MAG: Sec-independent protein translocase protein TatB [Rugosibacter sp.]|nr:Sec-independent protein translocase protein TatB [Rugosibacter sp.]
MFDVGLSELMVIGVVALVVIGPERLPKVARTAGLLLGRVQRYVSDVKADINREIQLDELKKLQREVAEQADQTAASVRHEVGELESTLQNSIAPPQVITGTAAEPAAAVSPGPTFSVSAPEKPATVAEAPATEPKKS